MNISSSVVGALAVCALALSASAATVSDVVKAVDQPQATAEAKSISNVTISSGHLTLTLASGSVTPLLVAGEPGGLYFKGKGTFRYEAAEPTELPSVAFNVRGTHLQFNRDSKPPTVTGSFTDLLLFAAGETLADLKGTAGAPSLADALAEHVALFNRDDSTRTAHLFALQKLAFPSSKFVRAEMSGGGEPVAYTYDGVDTREESLEYLRGSGYPEDDKTLAQMLYGQIVSSQPIGRERSARPTPPVVMTALDYSLVADGDNAKLEATETLTRSSAAQSAVRFNLVDRIFVRANQAPREFHVRSVTDEQGRALVFDQRRASVLVALDGVTGQTFKLKFAIDGDFLVREGGDNAWHLRYLSWYPRVDTWRQAYTVHSTLKVKKPFVPFASGKTIRRAEEGEYNVVENATEKPVSFTVAAAGKYSIVEDTRDGLTVRVASYGIPRPRASKQLIDLAFGIIDYYQYFLGPFPFPELNVVQVNDYGWGQAPPSTMFITNEAFDSVIEDGYFSEGINERFAHEIAHQYWGYVVAQPSAEEQWLSESFAEYSAALLLKKYKGEPTYRRLVNSWRSRGGQAAGSAPIPYANRVAGDPRSAFMNRFGLLYAKGPYLLFTLHKKLGDDVFLTFLKSYQKSFAWKFGSTTDVAGLLQFMTKTDYKPFFDQYFWGTAMPQ